MPDRSNGDGVLNALVAAALSAGLDDALVFSRGLDHPPAFAHVVADRLLDIDVLARLACPDRRQGVPVVGRGDRDGVDRFVVEQAANVLHDLGRRLGISFDHLGPAAGRAEINVADRRDAHVLEMAPAGDVVPAPAVDAAHRHPHGVVRPGRLLIAIPVIRGRDGLRCRNRGHRRGYLGRVCEKLSARERAHGWDPLHGGWVGGRQTHGDPFI